MDDQKYPEIGSNKKKASLKDVPLTRPIKQKKNLRLKQKITRKRYLSLSEIVK